MSPTAGAGAPEKRRVPVSGACSPVRTDTSVDLPAPLRPTRACASPGATVIRASRNATVAPYLLLMPVASVTGTGSPLPCAGAVAVSAMWIPSLVVRWGGGAGRGSLADGVAPQGLVVHVVL